MLKELDRLGQIGQNGKGIFMTIADPAQIKVSDVMHEGVLSCDSSLGLPDAAKLMMDANMRSLVVIDAECGLAGIVSQSDMVNARLLQAEGQKWNSMTIRDIMTSMVLTVTPDMTIKDAARLMIEYRIHRVVVAGDDNPCVPVGVLSMGDVMRHMME
jgi:CBS domain-containing protein